MSDAPRYRATAQVYLDRLYEPGQEILKFLGIPNRSMEPLNEAAEMAVLEAEEAKRLKQPVDPRDAEIVRLTAELNTVKAELATHKQAFKAFDADGDGKPGGGAKKGV